MVSEQDERKIPKFETNCCCCRIFVWTIRREWKTATFGNKKPEAKLFNTVLTPKLWRFEFIMPECIDAKVDHSENSKLVNNDCIVRFVWNNSEVFHCSKSLGNILNRTSGETVRTFFVILFFPNPKQEFAFNWKLLLWFYWV